MVALVAGATGLFRAEVRQMMPIIFGEIAEALARGEDVHLGDHFGIFFTRARRLGTQRPTFARRRLPACTTHLILFAPSLELRRALSPDASARRGRWPPHKPGKPSGGLFPVKRMTEIR